MKRLFAIILIMLGSQSVFALTQYSGIAPFNLYSWEQEQFYIDLSDATAKDLTTGAITYDPVYRIRNGYNPNLNGQLYFTPVGNYFAYQSGPGSANTSETFNVLIDMKNGDTLWPDYTMNVKTPGDLIQLLDVPSFNMSTSGGVVNFLVSSYDGETGARIAREDLIAVYADNGNYAPSKGVVTPHVSGLIDVLTYTANPGASGWDRILVFTRNEAGKMGYSFFWILIQ